MIYRTGTSSSGETEWFEACQRVSIDAGLVWKHYDHLERLETRYASQMERLRLLASTWLIGTFAAVGFVLFHDYSSPSSTLKLANGHTLAPEWVAFFVLLVGTLGTLLLWILDALVYRPLLAATFWEAIQLERMTKCLIPVRQQLARLSSTFGKGVSGLVSYYYLAIITVQLGATSVLLGLALGRLIEYNPRIVAIHTASTLLLFALLFWAQRRLTATRNWTTFERRALSES